MKAKVLTAEEIIKAIKKHKLKVTPVLGIRGQIDFWIAGYRKVLPHSVQNYVPNTGFAKGKTLEEAVEKLLKGKTVMKMQRGRLVQVE